MNTKKPVIVILHGWGLYGQKYSVLITSLEKKGYRVFAPDFPGFGNTPIENRNMHLSDYSTFLHSYLNQNKITECVLIGHSFGGRVAIKYMTEHPGKIVLLILTGVPIIRHFGIKKRIAFLAAKSMKIPFMMLPESGRRLATKALYRFTGEYDYSKSGEKKEVFKNIIEEALPPLFEKIKIPSILIWGEDDRLTPAGDIAKISKIGNVADSEIISGFGHALPYQSPKVFVDLVEKYITKYA